MNSKERIWGFVASMVCLHVVGLMMYANGYTDINYPLFTFFKVLWSVELGLFTLFIFIAVASVIFSLPTRGKKIDEPVPQENKKPAPKKYQSVKQKPTSKPKPPTKPPPPSPEELKQKAIRQILGKE